MNRSLLLLLLLLAAPLLRAAEERLAIVGDSSTWHGYRRLDFRVGGRAAVLVLPKAPAPGKPWIWRTEFFGHEPQADIALLGKGFHVAYLDVQNLYGAPVALGAMDGFYACLTGQYGLAEKPILEGFSRGGLFAFNWAASQPARVAGLYVDAPVCDFKSWPGGKGIGPGSPADWQRLLKVYGFNESQALAYDKNPVDNLAPLARAKIPILAVIGDADEVVPVSENINLVETRYREFGGSIQVIHKPGGKHHPHSLTNPAPIVAFALQAVAPAGKALAPTPAQLAWQQAEFGVMFHLDPRIFNDTHSSQSLQGACRTPLPEAEAYARKFNPTKLDTDQWAATAQAVGARFAILVVKHETGFCLWQSDANPFCLKNIPWRKGQADILRDFVASCRMHGLQPGIFTEARWDLRLGVHDFKVSPQSPVSQTQYNQLVEQEVEELCTRYGPLCELWFDGGIRAPDQGGPDVLPIVEKYQPGMLFYHSNQRRDARWGGSESGTVHYPCWSSIDLQRIKTGSNPSDYLAQGDPQGPDWCPAMADAPLRCAQGRHDWFWQPGGEKGVASLRQLQQMYYGSVGRNATLILGLTPDRDGLLPAPDVARCREFGAWLEQTFDGPPLAETAGSGPELTLELPAGASKPVTHVVLQEDIAAGERVRHYVVEAQQAGEWKELCAGSCIGHKRIETFPPCSARKFRLRLTQSAGVVNIRCFCLR